MHEKRGRGRSRYHFNGVSIHRGGVWLIYETFKLENSSDYGWRSCLSGFEGHIALMVKTRLSNVETSVDNRLVTVRDSIDFHDCESLTTVL